MSALEILWFIVLTGIAVSYGWGMRGALIGGEKGAMLPGALLGLVLAKCSGIPAMADNAVLFSAIGAMGTAFGGFEPYAQTADFMLHHDADYYEPSKAYKGILLKGANWFGISAAFMGIGISTLLGGVYKWYEIVAFFALEPFIQALGVKIFNKPFDREKGIFPKIYFSRNSREEWGGNTLMLLVMLVWTLAHRDWFAFLFGIVGIVAGGFGWLAAYKFDEYTCYPKKNGKYVFGKFQKQGLIDNWKIMEFGFGLVAGLCFAAYVAVQRNYLLSLSEQLTDGIWNPLGRYSDLTAWIAFGLYALTLLQYAFVFRAKKQGKKPDMHIFELLERPTFLIIPFALVLLGNTLMAELICFPVLMWLAIEEAIFDRYRELKYKAVYSALLLLVFAGAMVAVVALNGAIPMWVKILSYTVFYMVCDCSYAIHHKVKSSITVYGCFIVQSVILIANLYH